MERRHYSITIDAPKEKVWDTMLEDETYRQWTSVFAEGSYFEGSWDEGAKIKFIDPASNDGMLSRIAENRPYEFISIKHIGVINKGLEDTESEEAKKWAPAYENYTLTETDGATTVAVDMDVDDEYKDMFEDLWPKALAKLKALCEQ